MRYARVAAVILTVLSIFLVTRLRLSRDLTELFPATAEASALARVTRVFGGGDVALVLLEGDDPAEVERAANAATENLRKCDVVAQVVTGPPAPKPTEAPDPTAAWRWAGPIAREKLAQAVTEEGMRERLRDTRALLLAPGSSDVAPIVTRDPLRLSMIPWEGRIELAAGARGTPGGAFVTEDGHTRLLVVEPRGRAFESGAAAKFTREAEEALDTARKAHPKVSVRLTGGHVIAKETETMMRGDLEKSGVLSMVLASVVFVLTFRRPRALVAVLPPLAAGTLWTTALAALIYPHLSAIATAFAAVVVGVGVDTGVHVYGRLLSARREGHGPERAADIAFRETYRPTLGAALAAGGAFGCLALSDIQGMRQLGVLCAVGEVLTAVAILLVVPVVGCWLERGAPPPARKLDFVAKLTATRPRALLALAAAVACVAVSLALGPPKLDHGVVALDAKTLPALATYERIYSAFGGTRGQLVAVSSDADESRARARADAVAEVAEKLTAAGVIAGFDALGTIAPSEAAQRARLAERDKLDLPAKRALLERMLREEGFSTDAFEPALAAFAHPTEQVSGESPAAAAGMDWLVRRHLGKDEHGAIAVTYVRLTKDPAQDAMARASIRAADPEAVLTGYADLEGSLKTTLSEDLPRVLFAAMGMVLVVLAFSLKRPLAIALAVAVLVVEIAIVLLASRLVGARWHVYDALVLPVLLGITLDEALFLLEAAKHHSIDDALAEQAPLASATALTTAAGFGALVVCRFGGLVDVGKIGALGSAVGLVCALVVIPAGLRVLATTSRPARRTR
ncbi:membrane protein, exporter [Labilithrix luteola]|uniref:Membrane protein, exporter n=1 Tax=Labilithrix luteola TaxID=1391654 RepID=A0A0K1PQT8_9BACT|nr:MMPL family transporter [Labilithrix luteola]AKU95892.1 membrane protein, exporter [Labilithrix luteola]